MSIDALPYTVLLILAEFSVGCLVVLVAADARRLVVPSFVKLGAGLVVSGAALTLLTAFQVETVSDIDGFRVDSDLLAPTRTLYAVFLAASAVYMLLVLRDDRRLHLPAGAIAAAIGLAALGLTAFVFRLPTWGAAGVLLSLVAGALALGGSTVAMVWGHWYLVTPRLPKRPLEEMTLLLLAVLLVQGALLIVNVAIPAREVPESAGTLSSGLADNPAFWLRVGVGLIFPVALAYMAWQSSSVRAMMSATGLLYIAVGAVLAGEALARGLLFVTGVPV